VEWRRDTRREDRLKRSLGKFRRAYLFIKPQLLTWIRPQYSDPRSRYDQTASYSGNSSATWKRNCQFPGVLLLRSTL
jgi:hypothetical protein